MENQNSLKGILIASLKGLYYYIYNERRAIKLNDEMISFYELGINEEDNKAYVFTTLPLEKEYTGNPLYPYRPVFYSILLEIPGLRKIIKRRDMVYKISEINPKLRMLGGQFTLMDFEENSMISVEEIDRYNILSFRSINEIPEDQNYVYLHATKVRGGSGVYLYNLKKGKIEEEVLNIEGDNIAGKVRLLGHKNGKPLFIATTHLGEISLYFGETRLDLLRTNLTNNENEKKEKNKGLLGKIFNFLSGEIKNNKPSLWKLNGPYNIEIIENNFPK